MGLKWWPWEITNIGKYARHSRLCIRCRDQGFILPADPASPDTCRGHLAEERVNNLLGFSDG